MNRRPHRYPQSLLDDPDAEIIAWECAACGAVIREYGPRDESECPIDWRAPKRPQAHPNTMIGRH